MSNGHGRTATCEVCRASIPAGRRGPLPKRCKKCKRRAENRLERRRAKVRDREAFHAKRERLEARIAASSRAMGEAQRELHRSKAALHQLLGDSLEYEERVRRAQGRPWPEDRRLDQRESPLYPPKTDAS